MYRYYIKRVLDFIFSFMLLIATSWLFIILILLIKLTSQGSPFFIQRRIGIHKREFSMIKFRTMYLNAPSEVATHELTEPERYITPIGKFLRRTSLDELPQLLNIFMGNMSFVGPRPALWNQYDLMEERDKYGANDVMPGLTGYAQVNGRDELPIEVKAKYDGEYAKRIGVIMDSYCILKTIGCVVKQEGVKEGA